MNVKKSFRSVYKFMNPFELKPNAVEDGIMDWATIYPKPYCKMTVDPYTKVRIILMNGIEVEAVMFKHQLHRHTQNEDIRREIALTRQVEQQQQKIINWLKLIDETQLETTIGYEHVAVDLTAWLAQNEPDNYVKQALDFALLEDFDHLYRFSNLLDLDSQIPAQNLVKSYVDITPGRPTIAEHRHPFDAVRYNVDFKKADVRTMLNTMIITAGEQQTMNFYMNLGNTYYNDLGRKLYQEIAMIEEEHVTHYGSLLDPKSTWLEGALLHEYVESYLYYSFAQYETDTEVKALWNMFFEQEVSHLHRTADLLNKYEGKDWQQVIPDGEFPKLLDFHDTKEYVRQILGSQILLTAKMEQYVDVNTLPVNYQYFWYQDRVNHDVCNVASHKVVADHQNQYQIDYRAEGKANPVAELTDRKTDNTDIARKQTAGVSGSK